MLSSRVSARAVTLRYVVTYEEAIVSPWYLVLASLFRLLRFACAYNQKYDVEVGTMG